MDDIGMDFFVSGKNEEPRKKRRKRERERERERELEILMDGWFVLVSQFWCQERREERSIASKYRK